MLCHEFEELAGVALIGFDRLGRHAPLIAEMREPARDLSRNVGCGEKLRFVGWLTGHEGIVSLVGSLIVKPVKLAFCSGVMPAKAGIQYSPAHVGYWIIRFRG